MLYVPRSMHHGALGARCSATVLPPAEALGYGNWVWFGARVGDWVLALRLNLRRLSDRFLTT
jgi:hypothetical protein